jgi:hypothetical protein
MPYHEEFTLKAAYCDPGAAKQGKPSVHVKLIGSCFTKLRSTKLRSTSILQLELSPTTISREVRKRLVNEHT